MILTALICCCACFEHHFCSLSPWYCTWIAFNKPTVLVCTLPLWGIFLWSTASLRLLDFIEHFTLAQCFNFYFESGFISVTQRDFFHLSWDKMFLVSSLLSFLEGGDILEHRSNRKKLTSMFMFRIYLPLSCNEFEKWRMIKSPGIVLNMLVI